MKKFFCVLFFLVSIFGFASDDNGLGIVDDADLRAAGVKSENIKKAKELMNQVASNYELRLLERKQLELQINKYILDGPEKYLKQIDEMFDKIGAIEAAIMKERLRSQIQMKKYITAEQYMMAQKALLFNDDEIFHIFEAVLSRIVSQNRRRDNGAKSGELRRMLER